MITPAETWQKAVVPIDSTIQHAIHSLNESSCQIVMAVSHDGILEGTVTDGDIRRGLLKGLVLSNPIESIVHRNALVVPPEMGRDTVMQLMVANKIQQVPVIDEHGRVVGLHLWDTVTSPPIRANLMVIMAGGEGMRLRPLTEKCPKPLLAVAGKPMLEHIITRARSEGFSDFVLAVHYLGHLIEEYFGTGEQLGVRIKYLRERIALGTAGALSLLNPRPETPLVVTNGDVITDIHYGELLDFHVRHSAAATMAVRAYEWQHPFGVVQTKGIDIVGFEEKPVARSQINAGVYVLDPVALSNVGVEIQCDMPALFERLQLQSLRTVAYPMHEPWLDVGRPDDLARADIHSGYHR